MSLNSQCVRIQCLETEKIVKWNENPIVIVWTVTEWLNETDFTNVRSDGFYSIDICVEFCHLIIHEISNRRHRTCGHLPVFWVVYIDTNPWKTAGHCPPLLLITVGSCFFSSNTSGVEFCISQIMYKLILFCSLFNTKKYCTWFH